MKITNLYIHKNLMIYIKIPEKRLIWIYVIHHKHLYFLTYYTYVPCYCNSRPPFLVHDPRKGWCIKHVCKIQKMELLRYARMEITDRVTLTHCDRSTLPRASRTERGTKEPSSGHSCVLSMPASRYTRTDAWERKNMIPELGEVPRGEHSVGRSGKKRSQFELADARTHRRSGAGKRRFSWVLSLRGMKWRVVDSPNRSVTKHTAVLEVSQRQWLMVEETSSAYISLDSTLSADTPPPGMTLRRSSFRPPPDRAPIFFLSSPWDARWGKHVKPRIAMGLILSRGAFALLETVGETKTLRGFTLTSPCSSTFVRYIV